MSNDNSGTSEWLGAIVKSAWRINPTTYQYFEFSCGWGDSIAATVKKNKIFCILKDGTVWRIDPAFGEFSEIKGLTGWQTCVALASLGNHLYAFCSHLYRITVKNGQGSYEKVSDDWGNTMCATSLGDHIYAITKNGKLWQIAADGTYKHLTSGFEDTKAITSHNGKLYTFGQQIRRIDPVNPSADEKISAGWNTTLPHCATVVAGSLWAVTDSGKVWKINPDDGTYIHAGLSDWQTTKFIFPIVRKDSSNIENQVNEPASDDGYDIFISHRQVTGGDLAMNIKLLLLQENPNLRIFLDVDDLHNVHNLEEIVKNTRNIILLVTEGALDRPFVQLEIRAGLKHKKNFVLVHDQRSCNFPTPSTLPEDIREVASILAVPWMREKMFRDVSVKEIMKRLV